MEEECPLPPPGACSPELRDFLAQCMRKDPWQRPTAEQLLRHPFVLQQGCVGASLSARFSKQQPTLVECANVWSAAG
jgi:serine/threonine protein kinase